MKELSITRPDDWHLHLRDGATLAAVLAHTAARFERAIVMPNLDPPVTTTAAALAYRERIIALLPDLPTGCAGFDPLMTLYLTDNTEPEEISRAAASGHVHALKYYPAGATTNSDKGVTSIEKCYAVLEAMQECGMPLLVHGEVTDPAVDVFDRERIFIERILEPVCARFESLKIVFEHVTTADAVQFVATARDGIAATITPQHILLNRNDLFDGGIRPHHYCLPILKAESHREAVLEAAVSGNPRFFLGTDSAPHMKDRKESDCGCAGIYSAHAGIELYAEAFEAAGHLDRLENFASRFGAEFYGLPVNERTMTLVREPWHAPVSYDVGDDDLVPFRSGQRI
ncbi:MAG: dihydroorotase, partial [Gammaproteobacteria bacterium]